MKKLTLIILFFVLGFIYPSSSLAQKPSSQPTSVVTQSGIEKEYQFLKEQTIQFQQFIKDEREQHQKFLQTYLKYLAGLGTVATFFGLGSYLGALREAKKIGARGIANAIRENADELQEVLKQMTGRLIDEKLNLNKKILVIENSRTDFEQGEIEKLKNRGFKNIEVEKFAKNLNLDGYDLIIFPYSKLKDDNLTTVVKKLEENPIPVIAYSPKERVENATFDKYEWRGLANSPLTLVSQTFMVISSKT